MEPLPDYEHVHKVFTEHPNASLHVLASRLGWIHTNGRPQTWRVHRAMAELALEKRVTKVGRKWVLLNPPQTVG